MDGDGWMIRYKLILSRSLIISCIFVIKQVDGKSLMAWGLGLCLLCKSTLRVHISVQSGHSLIFVSDNNIL